MTVDFGISRSNCLTPEQIRKKHRVSSEAGPVAGKVYSISRDLRLSQGYL
jgi:hypothetical protein